MVHARAADLLGREDLKKLKGLGCHEEFRVRPRQGFKLAPDAKVKLTHKQVYEKLLSGEWYKKLKYFEI